MKGTPEELAARRAAYAALDPAVKAERLARYNAAVRAKRSNETPAQREIRLERNRIRSMKYRQMETAEKRKKRLEYLKKYKPAYVEKNREKIRGQYLEWYRKNRERIIERGREYRAVKGREVSARRAEKIKQNPQLIIAGRLRHRLYLALVKAGARKTHRTLTLAGCSAKFLAGWMSLQFKPGMSMENYGQWHIDHIIPCAAFDLTDESQQRVAFHFSNLRPCWAVENISKASKPPIAKRGPHWTLQCVQDARTAVGLFRFPICLRIEEVGS